MNRPFIVERTESLFTGYKLSGSGDGNARNLTGEISGHALF